MDLATGLLTGFGLAGAAGLNAYVPLLIVALAGRFTNWVHLSAPYDALTSWWAIGALVVLLTIEIFVDKIPAVDTINDAIQGFVRPAAGAVLFASSTNVITDVQPVFALVLGLLVAGGVHAVKATSRPVVTTMGGGLLNPVVSMTEDVVSAGTSISAILLPLVTFVVFFLLVLGFFLWVRHRKQQEDEYSAPSGSA